MLPPRPTASDSTTTEPEMQRPDSPPEAPAVPPVPEVPVPAPERMADRVPEAPPADPD